jgi:cytochrome c oxidase subunit 2
MRSQDVIHSAYMPHFRAQMNCVPGMVTYFKFTPTITTAEMRQITKNPDYDYLLLCNKICGAAHYNMQMTIIVDSQEDYDKWMAEQKPFMGNETAVAPEATQTEMPAEEASTEAEATSIEI